MPNTIIPVSMQGPVVLCCVAAAVAASGSAVSLDGNAVSWNYDGHGALSAGASSRLLIDYEEPTRSEILDLLFKPNFGASMHLIKVEIGGDGQSTDGTEPSHMHYRDDLNCERGYEFWLLQEARKRNPKIKTYALSWASPWWVGNQTGYYSDDEIDYHIKWLQCTKKWDIGSIDYMGNWNERPWGDANWTKRFKTAMTTAGFNTEIIIPDGNSYADALNNMDTDPEFKSAVSGIGMHYPCNHPDVKVLDKGLKFWSSEDYSTVGDWAGAGCWGRILNQNFVRMNMTSTISWSLIWSVYQSGFPYFGNGLMYAMTPWSGYYEAGQDGTDNGAAIWTNAHTCQFVEVGWKYLAVGKGAGSLSGGGSYVTLVSPNSKYFTVVLEKLEGRCLRCAGQTTSTETVALTLGGGLEKMHNGTLQLWRTNLTSRFVNEGNVSVGSDNTILIEVGKDSIVTISSWFNGQSKAQPTVPKDSPFPLPYKDSFDSYTTSSGAKYFADNGGSFQIAASPVPGDGHGKVVKQWVVHENGKNRWGYNVNPITLIGNASWTDVKVAVDVLVGNRNDEPPLPAAPTPAPTPGGDYFHFQSAFNGQCLDVKGGATFDATAVDTWSCVAKDNELFKYESDTGRIIDKNSGKCVTAGPSCHGQTLCIIECPAATAAQVSSSKCDFTEGDEYRSHVATFDSDVNAWTYSATDHTIRPRSPGPISMCLLVASKVLDATIYWGPCASPPNVTQQWHTNVVPTPSRGIVTAGTCVRTDRNGKGVCLVLDDSGQWTLSGGLQTKTGQVSGKAVTKEWTRLGITTKGTTVTASIDGKPLSPGLELADATAGAGMVSLNSNYNTAYFDNFEIDSA